MKKSKNRTPEVEPTETIKQLTEEKEFWHREALKNANECGDLKMKLTSFIYGIKQGRG